MDRDYLLDTLEYAQKLVGDQGIPAVLVPKEITKTVGLLLWQMCKTIKQQQIAGARS